MARDVSVAEEVLSEYADREGWSKRKQVEILLGFIDSIAAEDELSSYLAECTEDDDTESSDPFLSDDE